MARHIFASIAHSDSRRYVLDTDGGWNREFTYSEGMSRHMLWFPTLGDGNTQHGPEVYVGNWDAADYIFSLLKGAAERPELMEAISRTFYAPIEPRHIRFLSKIKLAKEGERRWFSLDLLKTSTLSDKQFDNRWNQIPEYLSGTDTQKLLSLFQIAKSYPDRLSQMWASILISDWVSTTKGSEVISPADFGEMFGLETDSQTTYSIVSDLVTAVRALVSTHKAIRALEWTPWSGYERNLEYRKL